MFVLSYKIGLIFAHAMLSSKKTACLEGLSPLRRGCALPRLLVDSLHIPKAPTSVRIDT